MNREKVSKTHESFIITLSLLISLRLLFHLILKVCLLNERIVQLGVSVANFFRSDEGFESFAESRDRSVVLRERRHDLWVTDDEGGRDTLVLDEFSDELNRWKGGLAERERGKKVGKSGPCRGDERWYEVHCSRRYAKRSTGRDQSAARNESSKSD